MKISKYLLKNLQTLALSAELYVDMQNVVVLETYGIEHYLVIHI